MQIISKNFSDPNASHVNPGRKDKPAVYYKKGASNLWTWHIQLQRWVQAVSGLAPSQNSQFATTTPSDYDIAAAFGYSTAVNFPGLTGLSFIKETSTAGFSIQLQAALASLSWPNLVSVQESIYIDSNSALLSVSAPKLVSVKTVTVSSNAILLSVSFPLLAIASGGLSIQGNTQLTSLLLPSLASVPAGSVTVSTNPALTALSLPSLTTLAASLTVGSNTLLSSLSLPSLTAQTGATSVNIISNPALTSISAPNLTTLGSASNGFVVTGNTSLTSFSFPSLVTAGRLLVTGCTNLTTVNLSSYLPTNGRVQNFSGAALTQASVDHILARCVANAAYVTGTVTLSGGTNATPGVQGLLDKATLQGRGCTVLTNE